MMHGHEKSDPAIVAVKPANKAEQLCCGAICGRAEQHAAEPVERREGTKGNADQQSTCRTQSRVKRVTGAETHTESRKREEEGEVHRALSPHQPRALGGSVLRT